MGMADVGAGVMGHSGRAEQLQRQGREGLGFP